MTGRKLQTGRLIACAAAMAFLVAADGPRIEASSGQFYRPNTTARGVREYKRGDYILVQPIYWHRAGALAKTIAIQAGGKSKLLVAGRTLPEIQVRGLRAPDDVITAWCTAEDNIGMNNILLTRTGGQELMRSQMDAQYCVSDFDADGNVDHSFLLNAGTPEDRTPKPIKPIPIEIRKSAEVSDKDDEVRIWFTGQAFPTTSLAFELEIVQQGRNMIFNTVQSNVKDTRNVTLVSNGGWPKKVTIFGCEFVIEGYDKKRKILKITWPEGVVDNPVEVPTETRFY